MLKRFDGPEGQWFLIEALQTQPIIGGSQGLAEAIAASSKVEYFRHGEPIIEEYGADNDLYLILTGTVSIRVLGREIAVRTDGQQIGEMALVDPGQPRSASAVAVGEVVVARLAAPEFVRLADSNPGLWKNVARILAARLRQRNRFIKPVNQRPVLFIGCSGESLHIGRAIQSALDHDPIVVKLWTDGVFRASTFPMESLERELPKVDFAVLVLSPDDTLVSRGTASDAPRDNLLLELGLFMGALGRHRTFILCPRGHDLKIPSDIWGIIPLQYRTEPETDPKTAVAAACNEIREQILQAGPN